MANVKFKGTDKDVMEIVTRCAAQPIQGGRYVHVEDAVTLSKSGLGFGKDIGNIERDRDMALIALGIALYGAAWMVYDYFEDDIKHAYSKLKDKWNSIKK